MVKVKYASVEYIDEVLEQIVYWAEFRRFGKVYLPKIGCGLGGLDWETEVKPIFERYIKKAHSFCVEFIVFDKE